MKAQSVVLVPKSRGAIEHWLVQPEAECTVILTKTLVNRSGAVVTLRAGSRNQSRMLFGQGVPVAIVLPVGAWRVARSDNGMKFKEVTVLDSFDNPPYGPSQSVNLTLDGAPFKPVWGRYTKIKVPSSKLKRMKP